MVVNVTKYTLFVTSHYDVWCWFGDVCWHSVHVILRELSLLVTVSYNVSL